MNKPKVTLKEKEVSSIDDQMREAWHTLWETEDKEFMLHCEGTVAANSAAKKLSGRVHGDVVVVTNPTDSDSSFYQRWLRSKESVCVDEKHFGLHAHQRETLNRVLDLPADSFSMGMWRGLGIHYTPFRADNYLIQGMAMHIRPLHLGYGDAFWCGGHTDRDSDYQTIGGNWPREGFGALFDNYVAPPKEPKSWDRGARHWYRQAIGGKMMASMALQQYKLSRHELYFPKFEWEEQREARRKLAFIKHVSVGTVGHIDWGTNSLRRLRFQCPGVLADCIRAAIKEFK